MPGSSQQSTLAPAVPSNVVPSTGAVSQAGLQSISEYLAALKNTADEKRYMFTCCGLIEKLRKKRTRMGNEGEIKRMDNIGTPLEREYHQKRTRKVGEQKFRIRDRHCCAQTHCVPYP